MWTYVLQCDQMWYSWSFFELDVYIKLHSSQNMCLGILKKQKKQLLLSKRVIIKILLDTQMPIRLVTIKLEKVSGFVVLHGGNPIA